MTEVEPSSFRPKSSFRALFQRVKSGRSVGPGVGETEEENGHIDVTRETKKRTKGDNGIKTKDTNDRKSVGSRKSAKKRNKRYSKDEERAKVERTRSLSKRKRKGTKKFKEQRQSLSEGNTKEQQTKRTKTEDTDLFSKRKDLRRLIRFALKRTHSIAILENVGGREVLKEIDVVAIVREALQYHKELYLFQGFSSYDDLPLVFLQSIVCVLVAHLSRHKRFKIQPEEKTQTSDETEVQKQAKPDVGVAQGNNEPVVLTEEKPEAGVHQRVKKPRVSKRKSRKSPKQDYDNPSCSDTHLIMLLKALVRSERHCRATGMAMMQSVSCPSPLEIYKNASVKNCPGYDIATDATVMETFNGTSTQVTELKNQLSKVAKEHLKKNLYMKKEPEGPCTIEQLEYLDIVADDRVDEDLKLVLSLLDVSYDTIELSSEEEDDYDEDSETSSDFSSEGEYESGIEDEEYDSELEDEGFLRYCCGGVDTWDEETPTPFFFGRIPQLASQTRKSSMYRSSNKEDATSVAGDSVSTSVVEKNENTVGVHSWNELSSRALRVLAKSGPIEGESLNVDDSLISESTVGLHSFSDLSSRALEAIARSVNGAGDSSKQNFVSENETSMMSEHTVGLNSINEISSRALEVLSIDSASLETDQEQQNATTGEGTEDASKMNETLDSTYSDKLPWDPFELKNEKNKSIESEQQIEAASGNDNSPDARTGELLPDEQSTLSWSPSWEHMTESTDLESKDTLATGDQAATDRNEKSKGSKQECTATVSSSEKEENGNSCDAEKEANDNENADERIVDEAKNDVELTPETNNEIGMITVEARNNDTVRTRPKTKRYVSNATAGINNGPSWDPLNINGLKRYNVPDSLSVPDSKGTPDHAKHSKAPTEKPSPDSVRDLNNMLATADSDRKRRRMKRQKRTDARKLA